MNEDMVAKVEGSKIVSIDDFIKKHADKISEALPNHININQLIRSCIFVIKSNPDIGKCSQFSMLAGVMQAAQLGLFPNVLGHCYFVPYKNNKTGTYEVQFQIGYKGMLELVRRSGEISTINAQPVYKNDHFVYEYGLNDKLEHKPSQDIRGELKCFYAYAKFKDGGHNFIVMSKADIDKVKKISRGSESSYSPWVNWYEEMAMKTCLKKLCKLLPLSIDVKTAIQSDETTKLEISHDIAGDIPDSTDWPTIDVSDELKNIPVNNGDKVLDKIQGGVKYGIPG